MSPATARSASRFRRHVMISARTLRERQRPFWRGPWMTTLLFAVICVTLLGPGPRGPDAAILDRQGRRKLQPERRRLRRCPNAVRRKFCAVAKALETYAGADHDPDRRPHQDAGGHQPRFENSDHANALSSNSSRTTSPPTPSDLDQDAIDAGVVRAFVPAQRPQAWNVRWTLVDIATTLQLVSDQFADIGHKVVYDGPEHAMATVRPDDLHRSITNLVENAVRFGAEATIRPECCRTR